MISKLCRLLIVASVASLACATNLRPNGAPASAVLAKPKTSLLGPVGGSDSEPKVPLVNVISSLYCGSFGLTLLANPTFFFAAKGLLPYLDIEQYSPLEAHFARMDGAIYTALAARVLWAPRSVATTRILTLLGLTLLPFWIFYAFVAVPTGVDIEGLTNPFIQSTMKKTIIGHSLVVAWGLVRSFTNRPDDDEVAESSVGLVNRVAMVYAAVAGVMLLFPVTFFGSAKSVIPFFSDKADWSIPAMSNARSLGGMLISLSAGSFLFAADSVATTKTFFALAALTIPLFIKNLVDKSGVFLKNGTWNKQITTHVVLAVWLWLKIR